MSWLWLNIQPQSLLAHWFHKRVQLNDGRLRKPTLVALARKLLLAFWKFITAGIVIEGAIFSAA
jgi:transposase